MAGNVLDVMYARQKLSNALKHEEAGRYEEAQKDRDRAVRVLTKVRPGSRVIVRAYEGDKDFQDEAQILVECGYTIQGQSGNGGHINVGRTALPALMTGGLSLIFGASRTKGKQIVTFILDPHSRALPVMAPQPEPMPYAHRYCNMCGRPIIVGASFCGGCGARLTTA